MISKVPFDNNNTSEGMFIFQLITQQNGKGKKRKEGRERKKAKREARKKRQERGKYGRCHWCRMEKNKILNRTGGLMDDLYCGWKYKTTFWSTWILRNKSVDACFKWSRVQNEFVFFFHMELFEILGFYTSVCSPSGADFQLKESYLCGHASHVCTRQQDADLLTARRRATVFHSVWLDKKGKADMRKRCCRMQH